MSRTLSVVIPVRDDAEMLGRCLAALARQTRQADEVIVVDNGSSDDSAEVARPFGATVVVEPEPGIPAAAATGYDAASGDVIVRCDADTRPPPDWLQRIEDLLDQRPDAAAVTGPGRFYDMAPFSGMLADLVYMRAYFVLMRLVLGNNTVFGSNFAMRASVWASVRHRVHRHDPEVHDDVDLAFHLAPTATVLVDRRLTVGISGRPFSGIASMVQRTRRASRTLFIHGAIEWPPIRWLRRIAFPRRAFPSTR